jgi:peroxin-2
MNNEGRYEEVQKLVPYYDMRADMNKPSATVSTLSRLSSLVSTTYSIAAFVSFAVFLINGRYRTLLDRILCLRLEPPTSQISRQVSFEYLNRQLVWHAFTEFLLFVLPLVGISRWKKWISRAWRKLVFILRNDGESGDRLADGGELGFLPERTCAFRYQDQNPTTKSENKVLAMTESSGGVIGSAQTDITTRTNQYLVAVYIPTSAWLQD